MSRRGGNPRHEETKLKNTRTPLARLPRPARGAAFALLALAAFWLAVPHPAHAADAWPDKPVKIIVPFAAGGTTDVVARLVGQKLGDLWGQPVIVEDRAGAGGNIGTDVVAKSPPDGYTLVMVSGSIVTANPYMYKRMPFDAEKDLLPVATVATGPMVLVVNATNPAKDFQSFIAQARQEKGKFTMGSAGIGSQVHLIGEMFTYAAGIEATHVPYKGESAAATDLMGNQITFMTGNLAAASPAIKAGRLRALAVTGKVRSATLPDVPTMDEAGLKGFDAQGWFGLMAPAGTPKEIVARINSDTRKVLDSAEMKARLEGLGMSGAWDRPEDMAAMIKSESARWAKVIKDRNIQAN